MLEDQLLAICIAVTDSARSAAIDAFRVKLRVAAQSLNAKHENSVTLTVEQCEVLMFICTVNDTFASLGLAVNQVGIDKILGRDTSSDIVTLRGLGFIDGLVVH